MAPPDRPALPPAADRPHDDTTGADDQDRRFWPSKGAESSDRVAIDLKDVEPETYPEDLVENGERWLLWQDHDGRKVPR